MSDAAAARRRGPDDPPPALAVVVKGWPRVSETFIAQELQALQERGLDFEIWSLRDVQTSPASGVHAAVGARVRRLPEYLHRAPIRVIVSALRCLAAPGFRAAFGAWLRDLRRDVSRNRVRRFGQACVLAAEAPKTVRHLYAHFLHTPASVTRYAAMMRGIGWSVSAHAKDIWTTPEWEKREKLAEAAFAVTCTRVGAEHLRTLAPQPDRVGLVYHGLDLRRFPPAPGPRDTRDGRREDQPVRLLAVGRLVEKKGYDVLIAALSDLPRAVQWRLAIVGGGPMKAELQAMAQSFKVADRISWRGALPHAQVVRAMRWADVFVMASRRAGDGDRDGLPNVLMEAASQNAAIVATRFSAIPEFIEDGIHGLLCRPGAPHDLTQALSTAIRRPQRRAELALAARERLVREFQVDRGADEVARRLTAALAAPAAAAAAPGDAPTAAPAAPRP